MFVAKNNKLYLLKNNERIVGVNYDSYGVSEIAETECELDGDCIFLEPFEARAKFNVSTELGYKFPLDVAKEVVIEVEDTVEVSEEIVEIEDKPKRLYNKRNK